MIGQTISHYRILEKLGGGGMGIVYKAEDTKLKRTVALKFLPPDLTRDTESKVRFIHEAQAASALDHPNICNIHDIAENEDGQLFIVMACYEGETLKKKIERGPLEPEQALELAVQIALGLAQAHEHGIIHRDLKPANVMVTNDGTAKIVDFGLAKLSGMTKLTKTGSTLGTVAYMSPEQLRGAEPDARADIFAFGVVLYEMLTAHLPFRGDHEAALMYSITNEAPVPLQSQFPDVSSDLIYVINRALEKEPRDRYQTMNDLVIDLQKLGRGTSTVSGPLPFVRRVMSLKKRRLVAGLTALTVTVVAVVSYLLFLRPSQKLTPRRIAVAVFENRTGDASLDALGTSISETIAQGMATIVGVQVVPSDSSIQIWQGLKSEARGSEPATLIRTFAERTGAGITVSGFFSKEGDEFEIRANATDANSGQPLRTVGPLASSLANRKAALEPLKQRLMGAISTLFDPYFVDHKEFPDFTPTYDSYHEFSVGEDLFRHGKFGDAIPHFGKSFQLDTTNYVSPLMEGLAYVNQAIFFPGRWAQVDSINQLLERSRVQLKKPELLRLNWLEYWVSGDLESKLVVSRELAKTMHSAWLLNFGIDAAMANHFREAITALSKIDDSTLIAAPSGRYLVFLTTSYHLLGNHDEELAAARKGRAQLPGDMFRLFMEVRALAALGREDEIWKRFDEACALPWQGMPPAFLLERADLEMRRHGFSNVSPKFMDKALEWFESRPDSVKRDLEAGMAYAYYRLGQWSRAKGIVERLHKENPDVLDYLSWIGTIAAREGDTSKARQIDLQLKNISRPYLHGAHTWRRACIASLLGEKEKAVSLLREALAQGQWYTSLHDEADLQPLWDYPPFQELAKPRE